MDTPALRKARGAFFTPSTLARFVAQWAVRSPADVVLEPSCGDAAFLSCIAEHLQKIGGPRHLSGQLHACEIHAPSAKAAIARLAENEAHLSVTIGDFFEFAAPPETFDAVVGNPPYVRYQQFIGDARTKSLQAALAQGVRLTGLASSWAAFTIHASSFLKADGRLGLVLPAELLSVNYASQVRQFLLKRFGKVRLVLFEERVFPGVMQEVLLLLAEGHGGASHFEVYQATNLSDLENICQDRWTGYSPLADQKWTPALLPADCFETYRRITRNVNHFSTMQDWGETYLGSVTGNNDWFCLSAREARRIGLPPQELLPISPPGSKHLLGLTFSETAWKAQVEAGKRCFLFMPGTKPSNAALAYVKSGERQGIDEAYKCRKRSPWWRVPLVERPDLFFTYMNHERPKLVTNEAGAHVLNSLYGVSLRTEGRTLGRCLLPLASMNSVTLLGAEVVGRSYGGGILKHEPKEVDLLPVPSLQILDDLQAELEAIRPQVALALRQGKLQSATEMIDAIVLERHFRLTSAEVAGLRRARHYLFQRRVTRGRVDRVAV